MARKGFTRRFPPLEILSGEDVEQITKASLDILRETGITLRHAGALRLLAEHDCIVDYDSMRVRFPEGLVEEGLRRCPSTFRVKAREPANDLIFGANTVYFMSSPGMSTLDVETWEPRTPTERDYIEAVTVLDALEHHDWFAGLVPYFGYEGVPEELKLTMGLARKLEHSTKFTGQGHANSSWEFDLRLAQAAGTEIMIPATQFASPLSIDEVSVEATFRVLDYGFPCGVDTGPLFGATVPATIAGALAQYNAELIAGLVLIQVKKPYSRAFVWGFPNALNMRSGEPAVGTIANALLTVACNQLWRDYGVPLRNTAPAYSQSKKIDFQHGFERAIPAILSAVSGASSVHLHGGGFCELTHSPIQAILDDDVAGMIGRFVEGVQVTDQTLALDLIHSVGPVPGQFLDSRHTLDWWKKEQFIEKMSDGLTYPEWIERGKRDCIDYAKERMKTILAEHQVPGFNEEQREAVDQILREAAEFYEGRRESARAEEV